MSEEPYTLVSIEYDKPIKKPQQIETLLCSSVAWSDFAPLVFCGTTDNVLHCYVPTTSLVNSDSCLLRWHTSYKKIYHSCSQFLDTWGMFITLVNSKITMYALPLHSNPHLEGNAMIGNVIRNDMMMTIEDTKQSILFAVHEEAKVVVCLTKQNNTLKIFDWTVNRTLELRTQHDLASILTTAKWLSPNSIANLQKLLLLGESYLLIVFKKDWCVVNVDSGKVLELHDTTSAIHLESISAAMTLHAERNRRRVYGQELTKKLSRSSTIFQDAIIAGKHFAIRVEVTDTRLNSKKTDVSMRNDIIRIRAERIIEYNNAPRAMYYHHPFVLFDMQDKVTIYRTPNSNAGTEAEMILIQTIPITTLYSGAVARTTTMVANRESDHTHSSSSFFTVSAPFHLQVLKMNSIAVQVRQLINNQDLDGAIALVEQCPDDVESSINDNELNALFIEYGVDLFRRRLYSYAIHYFQRAKLDHMELFHLYPRELLPRSATSKLTNKQTSPLLRVMKSPLSVPEGDELVKSLRALTEYLWYDRDERVIPSTQNVNEFEWIDTVLLKCLVLLAENDTNDNDNNEVERKLIDMMSQQKNFCEIAEAEVFLRAHQRFDALLKLYETRKLHRKALELLEDLERSVTTDSVKNTKDIVTPNKYLRLTANYLRSLGQSKTDLVFEFSRRVIFTDAALGLSIFTLPPTAQVQEEQLFADEINEDTLQEDQFIPLDPTLVVSHLKSCQVPSVQAATADSAFESESTSSLPLTDSRFLAIEYLIHLIFASGHKYDSKNNSAIPSRLHDDAVYLLLDAINVELQRLRTNSNSNTTTNGQGGGIGVLHPARLTSRVSSQRGLLGRLRRKLLSLLEFPRAQYHPERMLSRTPAEMVDERAALLSRLGRHHEVLQLYAIELRDAALAEAYCNRCFEANLTDSSIYSTLLRLYLRPPLQREATGAGTSVLTMSSPVKHTWQRITNVQLLPSSGLTGAYSREAVTAAISILNKYAERIHVPTALDLLPQDDVSMQSLAPFFRRVFERQVERFRNGQVKKQLSKMENFKVREQLTTKRKESVTVWSSHCCQVCSKKLGIGTFVRFPSGALLHYSCQPAVSKKD